MNTEAILLAVAAFVLGRLWTSSEEVFRSRQRAYSRFTEQCLTPWEVIPRLASERPEELLVELRSAAAEFNLFASRAANELAGQYMEAVAAIIRAEDEPDVMDELIKEGLINGLDCAGVIA